MKHWFKEVAKTILVLRQDSHVVAYRIFQDQEAWRKIYEEDQRNAKLYNYRKTEEQKRT